MNAFRATRGYLNGGVGELFPSAVRSGLIEARAAGFHFDRPDRYCRRCGATAPRESTTEKGCAFCIGQTVAWDRVVRLAAYDSAVGEWIVQLKFARQWSWGWWLGKRLARGIPVTSDKTAVCPVPMHWARRWKRGYNQARVMADAIAKTRRWRVADVLYRTRYTRPQTAVAPSQRGGNIRGSFAIRRVDLTGWNVWLVDDVKTSGSTLAACARLLKGAGAKSVCVAVAAVADPRGDNFRST